MQCRWDNVRIQHVEIGYQTYVMLTVLYKVVGLALHIVKQITNIFFSHPRYEP